jgi:hypothetical protein
MRLTPARVKACIAHIRRIAALLIYMNEIPRIGLGHPSGGQFTTMKRPEGRMRLTEPLGEFDQKRLSHALDRGQNMLGNPLSKEVRERLTDVVTDPTAENWDRAYSVILVKKRSATLWQSLLSFTSYQVSSRGNGAPWPSIPDRKQLLLALDLGTREPYNFETGEQE